MKAQLKRKAYANAGIALAVDLVPPKSPKAAAAIKSPRRSAEGKTKSPSQNSGKKQKSGGITPNIYGGGGLFFENKY